MHIRKILVTATLFLLALPAHAQEIARPAMVVGIMVDQMRWDYLYRFYNRYGAGGFRRLLADGYSCENTSINYSPSVTACGHASVYTGTVPAVHGIIGNDWYNRSTGTGVYCTEDSTVYAVGGNNAGRSMSPRNMLTTTIGDELRMATAFKSKVVSIALKDRAAILPGGHSATAAFWFDDATGNFISSSYYLPQLPAWATRFNNEKRAAAYARQQWHTLHPQESYTASTADDKPYEVPLPGENKPVFTHRLDTASGEQYGIVKASPFGNTLTLDFAKAAITGYELGSTTTDMLAISFSSPDIVGHSFGPNSIEVEDIYLRLDREIAGFLTWMDQRYGKNNYLLFLTADHGVAESPGFLQEHTLPGRGVKLARKAALNQQVKERFGISEALLSDQGTQLYLNRAAIAASHIEETTVTNYISECLRTDAGIADAVSTAQLPLLPAPYSSMYINGRHAKRSGDIFLLPTPGTKNGSIMGATHGTVYPYDTHIPLLWYGWHIPHGNTLRPINMTDIAPTLAALLHIQMPSGCTGQPVIIENCE